MSINLKILGEKIAYRREELGESCSELGVALGIEAARLIGIEEGSIEPTGDEILILSDHFRCDYKLFLTDEPQGDKPPIQVLYRAKQGEFSKQDRRAIRDFIYLCETESELSKDLGRHIAPAALSPRGLRDAEAIAAAEIMRAKLSYSAKDFTRDVFNDCRRLGIHIFRRRLGDSNISGLFIVHPVAGKCILINASEDVYRQRFSAAHELAHALFDADALGLVSLRSEVSTPLERRANTFASAYLMPPAQLRQLPDPRQWSDEMARHWASQFRVSCDALGVALLRSRIINRAESGKIRAVKVFAADKIDSEIPASLTVSQRIKKTALLEEGLSDFYVALCFDAHRQGLISAGRLAEALLRSPSELNEVAALYGHKLYAA